MTESAGVSEVRARRGPALPGLGTLDTARLAPPLPCVAV
jgi:hypothetical protein